MTATKLTPWQDFLNIKLFPYAHTQAALIRQIVKYTPPAGRILEVGFGSGWTAILLAQLGYEMEGIDIDESLVRAAIKRGEAFISAGGPQFFWEDLFTLTSKDWPWFDTGFSDGLFEHFTDNQVIHGLQILKSLCNIVIMDVPAWKYRHASIQRGDEIYRTNQEWRALIRRAGFETKTMYGSILHCPKWYRLLLPELLGKWFAPHFTTKVGFVL